MVAGIPINSPVMLNTIRVHVISTILGKGQQGLGKMCTGQIVKALNLSEAILRIDQDRDDQILLTHTLEKEFQPLLPKLKGVILEEYSTIPPDEIMRLNPNIVLISGVHDALVAFENDLIVSIDGEEKLIYEGVVEEKTNPVSGADSALDPPSRG
jgi:pyruvate kinase